jgi:general secretion pathway protein G
MKNTTAIRRQRRIRRGFSLIEVIVAVTIVAIFAAIVAPNLLGRLKGAKRDQAQTEVNAIANQVKIFLTENHQTSVGGDFTLDALVPNYLESTDDLIDPWGNRYIFQAPGMNGRDFDIVSYGADGSTGGEGEGEDIVHGKKAKKQ